MTKDHLAIPDFANNGMIQSVPSDPLLRSLTVAEMLSGRMRQRGKRGERGRSSKREAGGETRLEKGSKRRKGK